MAMEQLFTSFRIKLSLSMNSHELFLSENVCLIT